MMASLFDVPRRHHAQAADLGKAMQLTNICRDVAEDAAAGRRYLPATLCGWAPERIVAPTPQVRADVRARSPSCWRAPDDLNASGLGGLGALGRRGCVFRTPVAAALYREIGGVLRARDLPIPLHGRASSRLRDKALAWGAAAGVDRSGAPDRGGLSLRQRRPVMNVDVAEAGRRFCGAWLSLGPARLSKTGSCFSR